MGLKVKLFMSLHPVPSYVLYSESKPRLSVGTAHLVFSSDYTSDLFCTCFKVLNKQIFLGVKSVRHLI